MKIKEVIKSKFTRDTISLTLAQFVMICSGFFINVYIGGVFGFSSVGYFHQSLAFYMILTLLFAMGINNSILKKVAERKELDSDAKRIFSTSLLITAMITSACTAIALLVLNAFPNLLSSAELISFLEVHLLALPLFCLNKNFFAFDSSQRKQKKVAMIRASRWIGISLLLFLFVQFNRSLQEAMWSFVIIEASLLIYNIVSNISNFQVQQFRTTSIQILRFGMGSYISEITAVANASIDVIVVGYLLSKEDAGYYGFIIYFIKTLYIFPGILMQNLSPIIASHWAQNTIDTLNKQLNQVRKLNLSIIAIQSVFLVAAFYLSADLLGKSISKPVYIFSFALIGSLLFASISWGGSILIMTGKLKANFYRTALVLLLNITTFTSLTYWGGFNGSAIAVAINGLFSFILLRTFIYQQTGIKLI